jgi:hypothetical protein
MSQSDAARIQVSASACHAERQLLWGALRASRAQLRTPVQSAEARAGGGGVEKGGFASRAQVSSS